MVEFFMRNRLPADKYFNQFLRGTWISSEIPLEIRQRHFSVMNAGQQKIAIFRS